MQSLKTYFSITLVTTFLLSIGLSNPIRRVNYTTPISVIEEGLPLDSPKNTLTYPFNENNTQQPSANPLFLSNPSNVKTTIEYNPATDQYEYDQKIGDYSVAPPTTIDRKTYSEQEFDKTMRSYWRERTKSEYSDGGSSVANGGSLIPKIKVPSDAFERLFGSNTIDIRMNGTAELIFGAQYSNTDNPNIPLQSRRNLNPNFDMNIQMNATGKIGDKIQLGLNYNTQTGFGFDNRFNLKYEGKEDEIVQLIELGNVSLPLSGTLIQGSQALMGVKNALKFGNLTVTSVLAQQQGDRKSISVQGGAQTQNFDMSAVEYEQNKHFFLSQDFKNNYDQAMANLPNIVSNSTITRMEVYVTNRTYATQNVRNVLAFTDLGESSIIHNANFINPVAGATTYPKNDNNNLDPLTIDITYPNVRGTGTAGVLSALPNAPIAGRDYEFLTNARLLQANEYTISPALGFISLNQQLNNDEVLCVSYEYTIQTPTGPKVYRVGEFSTEFTGGTNKMITKCLKSTQINTHIPMWDLMMKNIYSLGAYQVSNQGFRFYVMYQDIASGVKIPSLPEGQNLQGKLLLRVVGLDKLNNQNDQVPDGMFDFMEGKTINSNNGRIIFPVREPFGQNLRTKFTPTEVVLANKYAFDSLYRTTQVLARQNDPTHNRFYLVGQYQSASGAEISLNAINIPQGSVRVSAGGIPLQEGTHYTVDYSTGRVKIIDQAILNSGTKVDISFESQGLLSMQTKSFIGTHLDYKINKDFSLGGTMVHLTERPVGTKISVGDEAISNTIIGLDGNYKTESRWITRMLDKLPFYSTKEISSLTASFEAAKFLPGYNKISEQFNGGKKEGGVSYIDDFEGAESNYDLKNFAAWNLASIPQGQPTLFKEASAVFNDSIASGFNRAYLGWYNIDPAFSQPGGGLPIPSNIKGNPVILANNYQRLVSESELYPNKQYQNGNPPPPIQVLNLTYEPTKKGPYNYDVKGISGISEGINLDGSLKAPETRWAGIMRKMEPTDFEAANINYLEFWLMDPFDVDNGNTTQTGGDFYVNIGNISEDVIKDNQQSFENGLPANGVNTDVIYTKLAKVPTTQPLVNAFDNNASARQFQDVGLDGMNTTEEQAFWQYRYLQLIDNLYGNTSQAYIDAVKDPSNDDYKYFLDPTYAAANADILGSYAGFNGLEGNSPVSTSPTSNGSRTLPDIEDINRDNTLNASENYFQYKISLRPNEMIVGQNYINDMIESTNPVDKTKTKWYQFRVPIRDYEKQIGAIQDFKSIRFMRLLMKNFDQKSILRFARLEFVRGEWRPYQFSLLTPGLYIGSDLSNSTQFNLSTVNLEENAGKKPINYVLPPGFSRPVNTTTTNLQQLNEQSLQIKACNLPDGEARAVYKSTNYDMRPYKKLKMIVHAEASNNSNLLDEQATCFIRLGSDFDNNFYEYEVPLKVTNGTGTIANDKVWLNDLEVNLQDLVKFKNQRDVMMQSNPGINYQTPYSIYDPANPKKIGRAHV